MQRTMTLNVVECKECKRQAPALGRVAAAGPAGSLIAPSSHDLPGFDWRGCGFTGSRHSSGPTELSLPRSRYMRSMVWRSRSSVISVLPAPAT